MFPHLFTIGPLDFRTLTPFALVALIACAFIFWRKGREEHYLEEELFDGFLLSTIFGLVIGRLGFIFAHFSQFGLNAFKWIDVISHPGVNPIVGLIAAALYLYRFARNHKWDMFEILDFWILGVSLSLAILGVGLFFDGSYIGSVTSMPWGMIFPNVFEKRHPVQLYAALYFLLVYLYLSKVEYRYRTFAWYRAGRNTAQTGFLISVFIILASLLLFTIAWVMPTTMSLGGLPGEVVVAAGGLVFGGVLLYQRSGRGWRWQAARRTRLRNNLKADGTGEDV